MSYWYPPNFPHPFQPSVTDPVSPSTTPPYVPGWTHTAPYHQPYSPDTSAKLETFFGPLNLLQGKSVEELAELLEGCPPEDLENLAEAMSLVKDRNQVREKALAKLDDEEKEALGL